MRYGGFEIVRGMRDRRGGVMVREHTVVWIGVLLWRVSWVLKFGLATTTYFELFRDF
jgi:hypothetical protein